MQDSFNQGLTVGLDKIQECSSSERASRHPDSCSTCSSSCFTTGNPVVECVNSSKNVMKEGFESAGVTTYVSGKCNMNELSPAHGEVGCGGLAANRDVLSPAAYLESSGYAGENSPQDHPPPRNSLQRLRYLFKVMFLQTLEVHASYKGCHSATSFQAWVKSLHQGI